MNHSKNNSNQKKRNRVPFRRPRRKNESFLPGVSKRRPGTFVVTRLKVRVSFCVGFKTSSFSFAFVSVVKTGRHGRGKKWGGGLNAKEKERPHQMNFVKQTNARTPQPP